MVERITEGKRALGMGAANWICLAEEMVQWSTLVKVSFGIRKMLGSSREAEQLLASEGLCCMQLTLEIFPLL
jgi:hypothetical protein